MWCVCVVCVYCPAVYHARGSGGHYWQWTDRDADWTHGGHSARVEGDQPHHCRSKHWSAGERGREGVVGNAVCLKGGEGGGREEVAGNAVTCHNAGVKDASMADLSAQQSCSCCSFGFVLMCPPALSTATNLPLLLLVLLLLP